MDIVAESFAADGRITDADVLEIAIRSGRSKRHVLRMVEEWLLEQAGLGPVPAEKLSQAFLVAVAEAEGNVAKAIELHFGADAPRMRSRVYKWMDEIDVGLKLALKRGVAALSRYLEVGVFVPEHRNVLWLMDEMKIPGRFRGPHREIIDDLWLISVFDAYSRLVLNAEVTVGNCNGQMAAAVLARAVVGGEWEGVEWGGSAEALGLDNAKIFQCEVFRRARNLAGVPAKFARPYTPTDKPGIERWHRTLQQRWLASFPGYLKGRKRTLYVDRGEKADGTTRWVREEVPDAPLDPDQLVPAEDAALAVKACILDYNLNFVGSDKLTAIQRYGADRTPLRRPGVAAFWDLAMPCPKPVYMGGQPGIWVDKAWRNGPVGIAGRQVTARFLPGLDPRYLVGNEGQQFLMEVKPTREETEDERQARAQRNRARTERIRTITGIARENTLERVTALSEGPYVSPKAEERLAAKQTPSLASVDAALAVPEREAVA